MTSRGPGCTWLALAVLVLACAWGAVGAQAQPAPGEVESAVARILAEPPFHTTRQTHRYQFKGWPEGWQWPSDSADSEPDTSGDPGNWAFPGNFGTLLGGLIEVVLWAAVVAFIVLLIVYRHRWMSWITPPAHRPDEHIVQILFGRDVPPEPLPEDIGAAAWQLWRDGDAVACLSLLYRGALTRIVLERRIELPASATEEDCIRRIVPVETPAVAEYFRVLTRTWQYAAYADRLPREGDVRVLCDRWRACLEDPVDAD